MQSQFKHHAAGSGPPFILLSSQVVQSRSYRTTLNVLSRCSMSRIACPWYSSGSPSSV